MASLTHVCMWSDNGWKRITAEQAARLHPGGTVSAHSGLFMCELCGQYVILTDGDIRIRYFKHSAYEKSKDCPERTFGAGYSISYGSQEHDLPIRITSVSSSSFSFEVGLIRAPISSLGKDFCIEIKPKGAFDIPYVYTKERLNYDSITYLPIGERPFEKYTLSFQNGNDKLREFWPAEIKGIDPEGTLFEKVSGKKLSYDADVEIGKEYYLLKRGYIYRKSFLAEKHMSLDTVPAAVFLEDFLDSFKNYLASCSVDKDKLLLPIGVVFHYSEFADELKEALDTLKEKCHAHPELFGVDEGAKEGDAKVLLDALYEEGIIPTYSFPKNHC